MFIIIVHYVLKGTNTDSYNIENDFEIDIRKFYITVPALPSDTDVLATSIVSSLCEGRYRSSGNLARFTVSDRRGLGRFEKCWGGEATLDGRCRR